MLIKSADDKSSKLKLLEAIDKLPLNKQQREQLTDKLWKLRTGINGEKDAAFYIDNYLKDSEYYIVIHDLRIEIDGESAQIDHLLINRVLPSCWKPKTSMATSLSTNSANSRFNIPVVRKRGFHPPLNKANGTNASY